MSEPVTTGWSAHRRDTVIAGRRVRYVDIGTGSEAFVLIHGMGGRWQHWARTIGALAPHRRVLALDLPGFGGSERFEGRPTLDALADVVAELAGTAGVRRAVLVGHSLGGPIALRTAARHPDLAEAVVVVCGAIFHFGDMTGFGALRRLIVGRPIQSVSILVELLSTGLPAPALVRRRLARSALARRLVLWPYLHDPAGLSSELAAILLDSVGAPGVAPTARAFALDRPLEHVEDIACPVVSVTGLEDRVCRPGDADVLYERLPGTRVVDLAATGHMAMLEQPDAVNAEIVAAGRARTEEAATRLA